MVAMEVTGVMAKTAPKSGLMQETENAEWLCELLADVRVEVAKNPTPVAVRRMRAALTAGMKRPAKIAA